MRYKKRRLIACISALMCVFFLLSGCGRVGSDNEKETIKGKDAIFETAINGSPATLDPQTSLNDSSVQVIRAVFRGLYAVTDGGEVVPDMAESCEVSEDGLVWDIKLREDIRWYSKNGFDEECTAEDYVFAFRRLEDPNTMSKRAAEYYCIKNAEDINKGRIPYTDALGVEATERFRLRITLREPCPGFRTLLAAPPAMPCSKKFFEQTQGQYGLLEDCIASNGDFYLNKWFYDKWVKDGNFITLRRNVSSSEVSPVYPYAVKLDINTDGFAGFRDGTLQVYSTASPEEVFALSGKYRSESYKTAVWGIIFNNEGVFGDAALRLALGSCVGAEPSDEIYTKAEYIVPDGITAGEGDYRALAGSAVLPDHEASELYERYMASQNALAEGTMSGIKLLMPENTGLRQYMGSVFQEWQKNYGFYCAVSELGYNDYISALSDGNFDIALVRLNGGGNGAVSYIESFSASSSLNYGRVKSKKLENIISGAKKAGSDKQAAAYCLEAEQLILDNCWFCPLCFENEFVFSGSGVSGVGYDPFAGTFIFKYALKTE